MKDQSVQQSEQHVHSLIVTKELATMIEQALDSCK